MNLGDIARLRGDLTEAQKRSRSCDVSEVSTGESFPLLCVATPPSAELAGTRTRTATNRDNPWASFRPMIRMGLAESSIKSFGTGCAAAGMSCEIAFFANAPNINLSPCFLYRRHYLRSFRYGARNLSSCAQGAGSRSSNQSDSPFFATGGGGCRRNDVHEASHRVKTHRSRNERSSRRNATPCQLWFKS
jgi:hypothetical protein